MTIDWTLDWRTCWTAFSLADMTTRDFLDIFKKQFNLIFLTLILWAQMGCVHKVPTSTYESGTRVLNSTERADPFLWLEDIYSERSLKWVKERNESTIQHFKTTSVFNAIEPQVRQIILAKDRVPSPKLMNGMIYNFWQDEINLKGVWRRTSVESYRSAEPQWEILLDIDQLAKKEKENWVFKGANCLAPQFDRCLMSLSRAGKDASVVREFQVSRKDFVENGFMLPEAKSRTEWIDEDTLYVATDFGPGSLTNSGYPRILKKLKRGQSLTQAKQIFEGLQTDVSVSAWVSWNEAGEKFHFATRSPSFFEEKVYLIEGSEILPSSQSPGPLSSSHELMLPNDINVIGLFQRQLLIQLRSDWKFPAKTYVKGSLLEVKIQDLLKPVIKAGQLTEVYKPLPSTSIEFAQPVRGGVILGELNHVKSKVYFLTKLGKKWKTSLIKFPSTGSIDFISGSIFEGSAILSYSDFLTPSSLFLYSTTTASRARVLLKEAPVRFDASGMIIEQFFVKSKDGVRIPYFLVRSKDLPRDGQRPTLMYGYGGFENSMSPYYSGVTGKIWLSQGGIYVVANIRGGGEYGPKWHQSALKEKRQNAYNDFIAVGEDLVRRKWTSPDKLGIMGGSNGGLLMGVMLTQRPSLFKAIVCQVPLLDMLRYHKLLAGASWVGEYGNPDLPDEKVFIEKYSPYQNLNSASSYPKILFTGSTADDRVHPAHMRKMAAKMEELGKPFYYFENTEGGHGGVANLEQKVFVTTLEWAYLSERLKGHH